MKLPLLVFSAISLFAFTAKAEPLTVGAAAPVVTAKDQDGEPVNFADVYSKGTTLVYFYPKAGTPGCTAQACSLRDSFADLSQEGLQVIGVSEDTVDSQKKFKDEQKLPFTLVADSDGKVADAFGVPVTMGRAKRQSFIVKEGKIAWVSPQAKTTEHAQEVQAALGSPELRPLPIRVRLRLQAWVAAPALQVASARLSGVRHPTIRVAPITFPACLMLPKADT